jgi:hypothetical protein
MKLIKEFFNTAWRWQNGRQQSGYDKMLLLWGLFPLPFDIYLIRYRLGSYIKPHIDQVKSGRHYRLNIVLKQSKDGGDFVCDNCIINTKRIKLFRPDVNEHSVTEVKSGNRYILSIGWVRK